MKLLVLPGDGIGEEIGFASLERHGTPLTHAALEQARSNDGIILGPISHLDYPAREAGGINVSATFRVQLDL